MKKFISFCMLAVCVMGLPSCSDNEDNDGPDPDVTYDFAPINVGIYIEDVDGNNLLNTDVAGNWVGAEMSMTYKDKTYNAVWRQEDFKPLNRSRFYLPTFYGLAWSGVFPYLQTNSNYLKFGELDRTSSYDDNLTLSVAALNRTFEFKLKHRLYWKDHKPVSDTRIIYNGKDYPEGEKLVLVFPKNTEVK